MNELINLVNNVGFPIIACVYVAKTNTNLINSFNELSLTLKGIDTRLEILERGKE